MVRTPRRGEIWWADLGELRGSAPGHRRPVLIVQEDHFNQSQLATVIVLSLTSNLRYAHFPGNVALSWVDSGLEKDSVINITQLTTVDKSWLDTYVADLPASIMLQVEAGLSLILGL
ncbi:MAG: type II toxin-antitoxin system PemK/MazF family toxin [Caldilinea sp. CFX5]|nr:type II toxin-antitoxin system PemK/MazF family toxin [Caldilinea sp. CFX5]